MDRDDSLTDDDMSSVLSSTKNDQSSSGESSDSSDTEGPDSSQDNKLDASSSVDNTPDVEEKGIHSTDRKDTEENSESTLEVKSPVNSNETPVLAKDTDGSISKPEDVGQAPSKDLPQSSASNPLLSESKCENQSSSESQDLDKSTISSSEIQELDRSYLSDTVDFSFQANDTNSESRDESGLTVSRASQLMSSTDSSRNDSIVQRVENELNSHPMKLEEEVLEGFGEKEEESGDSDQDVDVEEVGEDQPNNAQQVTNSVTNDENEADINANKVQDEAVVETVQVESSSSVQSPGQEPPAAPSISSTSPNAGSEPGDFLNTSSQTKRKIDSTIEDEMVVSSDKEELPAKDVGDSQAREPEGKRPKTIEPELPKTVQILESKSSGAKVYLIGTAHFSQESCEDVSRVIAAVQPDVVMLELCKQRTNLLHLDEETILAESQNLTLSKSMDIVKEQGGLQGVMYLLLLSMSAHITKELGMAPGGEFRRGFQEAMKVPGCLVHLGDRPIGITLKRALSALSAWQKVRLGFNMLTSKDTITKEDVEKCKEKDLLENLLEEMAGEFPALSKVFVDERDVFLTHSLQTAAGLVPAPGSGAWALHRPDSAAPVVVGVVGIGHVPGIVKYWGSVTPDQVRELLKVEPPSKLQRATIFAVKLAVLGGLAFGAYKVVSVSTRLILSRVRS